jgi:hypothetical protein
MRRWNLRRIGRTYPKRLIRKSKEDAIEVWVDKYVRGIDLCLVKELKDIAKNYGKT